jgi:hypothetical protein
VKFVGKVDTLAAGYWVGVQYDEPVGKHDGVYALLTSLGLLSMFQLQIVSLFQLL